MGYGEVERGHGRGEVSRRLGMDAYKLTFGYDRPGGLDGWICTSSSGLFLVSRKKFPFPHNDHQKNIVMRSRAFFLIKICLIHCLKHKLMSRLALENLSSPKPALTRSANRGTKPNRILDAKPRSNLTTIDSRQKLHLLDLPLMPHSGHRPPAARCTERP